MIGVGSKGSRGQGRVVGSMREEEVSGEKSREQGRGVGSRGEE